MPQNLRIVLIGMVTAVVATACGGSNGRAMCELRKSTSIASGYCWDITDTTTLALVTDQQLCGQFGGKWTSGKQCDHSTAVGGCRIAVEGGGYATRWFYPDGKHPTVAEFATSGECGTDTIVDAAGNSLKDADLAAPSSLVVDLAGSTQSLDLSEPPPSGTVGMGDCQPALSPLTCDSGHSFAYSCYGAQNGVAPSSDCVSAKDSNNLTYYCCPSALCQRTSIYDAACSSPRIRSYTCYNGATAPNGCEQKTTGNIQSYCCP